MRAVIGDDVPVNLLRDLQVSADVDGMLRILEEARVVYRKRVWPDEIFVFHHKLFQSVAYHTLTRQRRTELHRKIARSDVLEGQHGVVGRHLAASGDGPKAFESFRLACDEASRKNLRHEARSWWELAAAIVEQDRLSSPNVAVHLLAGASLALNGAMDWSLISRCSEQARELFLRDGETRGVVQATLDIGASYASIRHPEALDIPAAIEEFTRARRMIKEDPDSMAAVIVDVYESNAHRIGGAADRELACSLSALRSAEEIGHPLAEAPARMTHGITLVSRGEMEAAFEQFRAAWDATRRSNRVQSAGIAHTVVVSAAEAALVACVPLEGLQLVEDELALDRQGPEHRNQLRLLLSLTLLRLGREFERPELTPALAVSQPFGSALWLSSSGHHTQAQSLAASHVDLMAGLDAQLIAAGSRSSLALTQLLAGDYTAAQAEAGRAASELEQYRLYRSQALITQALASAFTGDVAEGRAALSNLPADLADDMIGLAAWRDAARALLTRRDGQHAPADKALEASLATCDQLGLAWDKELFQEMEHAVRMITGEAQPV